MTPDRNTERWVSALRPCRNPRIRLLCFPHAGAGASVFRHWANLLPDEVEVCPIQLPGRENRVAEKPFSSVKPLVETLAWAVQQLLQPPFAFFGNSMGALIAFEFARFLRETGQAGPAHLFVAARSAPHLPDSHTPIHNLPTDAFAAEVARLNGTPAEVLAHEDLMQLMIPLLRADFELCETYRYEDRLRLGCPISAFAGREDVNALPAAAEGWGTQTTSEFRLRVFEGGHFFVDSADRAVTEAIAADLSGTIGASAPEGAVMSPDSHA